MNHGKIMVLALAVALSACQAETPASATSQARADTTQSTNTSLLENSMDSQPPQAAIEGQAATSAGQALDRALKSGMAYADFRKRVLAGGWMPVVDAECKVNVVGGNHETLCAQNPDLVSCQVCDRMPELSACSGDGHCLVRFSHTGEGEALEATGYGMIEDWNVHGEDSRLQLSQWSFSKLPAH